MNAVTKHDAALPAEGGTAPTLLDIIARAATDSSVDVNKLERLMQMAREVRQDDAKAAYIKALVKMKPELPVIDRKGRIEVRKKGANGERDGEIQQSTAFARWEDIDEAITPILASHGFVLTHRSGMAPDGKLLITGVLSHEQGHSEETTMALPHDSSGSKNAVQAVGSSTSYGKRYTATLLLNIRTKGEDDDGDAGGREDPITEEQVGVLNDLIERSKSDIEKFCTYMKVSALNQILGKNYGKALEALNLALNALQQKQTKVKG